MKIPRAHGVSSTVGGKMIGQTVPMRKGPMNTTLASRSGFTPRGSLIGHVEGIRGQNRPSGVAMQNAPFRRPQDAPAATNTVFRQIHNYNGKRKI